MIEELTSGYERADCLQDILMARATGGASSDVEFVALRQHFLKSTYSSLLPNWLRSKRSLDQFWPFIQAKFPTYKERRNFIAEELNPLLEATEAGCVSPVERSLETLLESPSYETVAEYWQKCLDRSTDDPDGAVTAARTLLETVLKHLVDELGIVIERKRPDLPELYDKVARRLKLSPSDHSEKLVKGILSGCNSVVTGIGDLRNTYGDAHGSSRRRVRLERRHAHLAVNLAGAMASFLIETAQKSARLKE